MKSSFPSTQERCKLLLNEWRSNLVLSHKEQTLLKGELKTLDLQIKRLNKKRLRLAAFGRVGVGKSSLLNALLGQKIFDTDVAHGCTRFTKSAVWKQSIGNIESIEFVDTPGIDEIDSEARGRLAARLALQVDLVLLVLDSDITRVELEALEVLIKSGKPVLLALNRCDQWEPNELKDVITSIRNRLPQIARKLEIQVVAASPRVVQIKENGRVRSRTSQPMIKPLLHSLKKLLSEHGELLLALNALRQADHFSQELKLGRLKRSKTAAQGLIGKFAAIKATGVAINPLLAIDLAGGLACDTALIIQLSKLYGLQMKGHAARQLLKRVSLYNAFLGGAQLGIQLGLGALRQLLVFMAPITGGLSLASAAPVAVIQAAMAIHTTKITGRLAAQELLHGTARRGPQPRAMLKRLSIKDPNVKRWLKNWPAEKDIRPTDLQALLP